MPHLFKANDDVRIAYGPLQGRLAVVITVGQGEAHDEYEVETYRFSDETSTVLRLKESEMERP